MIAIAVLTLHEARRRRLFLVLGLLTVALAALAAWGFAQVHAMEHGPPMIVSQLLVLVMFMFSFILGMTAVFLAAPSLSSEVESGVAQTMAARPIRRAELVAGKWLGQVAVISIYAVGGTALLVGAAAITTGYMPPSPVAAAAFLAAQGTVGVTFALLLSTRMSAVSAGAIAVVLFGIGWIGGIVGGIGASMDSAVLERAGILSRLALPTDGLWRGAVFSLQSPIVGALAEARMMAANPFFAPGPPPAAYLAWVAAWIAATLGAAVLSFRSREL